MLETQEQIDLTLSLAGEPMEFDNGILKGIPGELIYNVQGFDSPYDIDKQDFNFRVSNQSFFDLGIKAGDNFLYSLVGKLYKFQLISFSDDLTGWLNLRAKIINIEQT